MRNLLTVCAALIVVLVFVSGNLWRELRADRRTIAELQDQLALAKTSAAGASRIETQVLQPVVQAQAAPAAVEPAPAPVPLPPGAQLPVQVPASAVVLASLDRPPTTATPEERLADAYMQSDQTATARVLAWRDRLTLAGQTLTTEQLQALNAVATGELRRETKESLEIDNANGTVDLQTAAKLRQETVNRQNQTNLRILEKIGPRLNAAQIKALRDVFEAGHVARQATLRAELERLGIPLN
jgi:hypothetical protein